jgi:hypothetical protein
MNIDDVNNRKQYRQYINEFCDILIDEYDLEKDDDAYHTISMQVDQTKAHLYYSYNMTILQFSDNEPHEWNMYVDDNESNYRKVIQAMAYVTLRQDVIDELEDRDIDLF